MQAVSFVQFESMIACLSSRIPLKEIIKFKYSETKDNCYGGKDVLEWMLGVNFLYLCYSRTEPTRLHIWPNTEACIMFSTTTNSTQNAVRMDIRHYGWHSASSTVRRMRFQLPLLLRMLMVCSTCGCKPVRLSKRTKYVNRDIHHKRQM